MHVLPLPFGLALALLRRHDAPPIRPEPPPAFVMQRPSPREQILGDLFAARCRRPVG